MEAAGSEAPEQAADKEITPADEAAIQAIPPDDELDRPSDPRAI